MRISSFAQIIILISLVGCMYVADGNSAVLSDFREEIASITYARLDFYKNTVNLTPLENADQDIPTMTVDNYQAGFLVSHGLDFSIGIGPSDTWYFNNMTNIPEYLWRNVGIALVLDKSIGFVSYIDKKENINVVKKQKRIPYFSSELKKWREGDSVFFQSQGGLALTGRLGAYGFGVGPTFIVSGTWGSYIEKLEDNKVFVQIQYGVGAQAHVAGSTYVAEISCSLIKELSKGFTYIYDLNYEVAAKAYEDLLKGNVIPSQSISEDNTNLLVRKVDKLANSKFSRVKQFSMGIPFFNYSAKKEKNYEHAVATQHAHGQVTESYLAAEFSQTFGQVLNRHRVTTDGFYSGLRVNSNSQGKKVADYTGIFNWHYSSDHGSSPKLRRALKKLFKKTGLDYELDVNLPDEKKLKYTAITYTMSLPYSFINYLVNTEDVKLLIDSYRETALKILEQYFEDPSDPLNLCMANITKIDWLGCKFMHSTSLRLKLGKMKNAVLKMQKSLALKDKASDSHRKEFVKSLTSFGNAFSQNIFLFNTIYTDAQKCGLEASYKIEGERLSRYIKETKFKIEKSCLSPI